MIEKIDKNDKIHGLSTHTIIDKINEIIDFLNDTYLMKVKDGQSIILDDNIDYTRIVGSCTDTSIFVTGLSTGDDTTHYDIDSINNCTTITSTVKCPHCGESYYTIEGGESTCVNYPPIMKDGININPDRNIHTTHCRCLNCQTKFDI